MPDYSFPKKERLKSRKIIHRLFEEGDSLGSFPVRVFFLPNEALGLKAGFAVPKKKFRSAVSRNKVKRLMRETYRLQKSILGEKDLQLSMMFLYLGNDFPEYERLYRQMGKLLKKISKHQFSPR
ncbi:MAG: ribonuclease P protein component [Saprospiraceae bacterium]|nr:ribonuclease P protein component [Saprospiraceae bacterium]